MRERRRKEEEEARLSLERARKAFLQVRAGGGASVGGGDRDRDGDEGGDACRSREGGWDGGFVVPGVPQAPAGGAEGREEEVAGSFAKTKGGMKMSLLGNLPLDLYNGTNELTPLPPVVFAHT